jgi:hypothetical protein
MVLAHYFHSFVVIHIYFSTLFFESKCLRFIKPTFFHAHAWLMIWLILPKFHLFFIFISMRFLIQLGFPILQSFNYGPSTMHIYTTIDSIGIHLYNVFTSIRIQQHMMQCDTFASIAHEIYFHVRQEWLLACACSFNYIQLLLLIC